MSITRYFNTQEIISNNNTVRTQDFDASVLKLLAYDVAELLNISTESKSLEDVLEVESHIYNLSQAWLKSDYITDETFVKSSSHFYLNYSQLFDRLKLTNGTFKVVNCYLINALGSIKKKPIYVTQIGASQTEIELTFKRDIGTSQEEIINFYKMLTSLKASRKLNNLYLNFGENKQYRILNFKKDVDKLIVKVALPLGAGDYINSTCFISYKVLDDTVTTVTVQPAEVKVEPNVLRGPKFDVSLPENSAATITKSWETLLDVDTITTDRIVGDLLSGSRSIDLNIDYTNFENYIYYGSAAERVKNFDYKLGLIDYYASQSRVIEESSASSVSHAITNKLRYSNRINTLKSSFDGFEKYLYYETGSIFTHDISGPIIPVPKYISTSGGVNRFINYDRTSSIYTSWYTTLEATASIYDTNNYNSLYWTTPDHVLRDPNNDQYIVFLNMVGQHFDTMYTYVRELTGIHRRDEHSKRGIPNKLLPIYAEALGWILQDTHQLSDLWLYKLGMNNSGSLQNITGSLASKAHEQLSNQIWRRIVNNLPYLLKTKGTDRSVKALISTYGIPQTLISIKEYGGPRLNTNKPNFQEDRFSYALNFKGSEYVKIPRIPMTSLTSMEPLVPSTVEFRFRTDYTSSVSMSLWAVEGAQPTPQALHNLELVHFKAHTTGSINGQYSGSHDYGYLKYTGTAISPTNQIVSSSVSTGYLPLYDDDFWNVRIYTNQELYSGSAFDGNIHIEVQKASNCTDNRISASGSAVYTYASASHVLTSLITTGSAGIPTYNIIGGTASGSSVRFSGSLQGYKEYFESFASSVFDEHTLNPAAYYTNNYSSSYRSLARYYPLGLDNIRYDHTVVTQISSSHPNRNLLDNTVATMYNFTGTEASQYSTLAETYYINIPSIGANNLKSQRIRIEPNVSRYDLSPSRRSEKSLYDTAQNDSNRLAIVFSPTDQINRDIVNNFGYLDFDDLLGDPLDTHKEFYTPIRPIQNEYWKKYIGNSNLNTFIRIFSLYDYTVFEQIKQLIPARAAYIGGVLIEGNILERPRVARKYPTLEQAYYETDLEIVQAEPCITYNYLTASIDNPYDIDIRYDYFTGSITYIRDIDINYNYITGSIKKNGSREQVTMTSSANFYHKDSREVVEGILLPGDDYYRLSDSSFNDYHLGANQQNEGELNVGVDYYTLNGNVISHPQATAELLQYTYKDSNGVLQEVTQSVSRLNPLEGNYKCIIADKYDNNLKKVEEQVGTFTAYNSGMTLIDYTPSLLVDDNTVTYKYTSSIGEITPSSASFTTAEFKKFIEEYKYYPVPYSTNIYRRQNRGEIINTITGSRATKGYSKVIYHYSSSRDTSLSKFYLGFQTAYSESMKMYYSKSLAPYNYQYTEDSVRQRIRFGGSKLTGPAINVTGDNPQTVDNGPVIVVKLVEDSDFVV